MHVRRATVICATAVVIVVSGAGCVFAQTTTDWQCAQDLNNNGVIDSAEEQAQCLTTADGPLCPISVADCVIKTSDPICPPSTALNPATGMCETPPQCPSGTSLNPATDLCETTPGCSAGSYDSSQDLCVVPETTASPSCPYATNCLPNGGPGLDPSYDKCICAVLCGWFSCHCPSGYTLIDRSGFLGTCGASPICSIGSYIASRDTCVQASYTLSASCPSGASLDTSTDKCEATPACSAGTYDNNRDVCAVPANTVQASCPFDTATTAYQCRDNNGTLQCSLNECIDAASNTTASPPPDLSSLTDDGTVDPNTGECYGQIMIFNGHGSTCRPPGVETNFHDCCSNTGNVWFEFTKNCKGDEKTTNDKRDAGQCHYIGKYCKLRWNYGFGNICVQMNKVYCCFQSKLGRIIHEQGRPQLQKFQPDGNWGNTDRPNCVGFRPEEFQMLDFSRMDLSEYFADIQSTMSTQVQDQMKNAVDNFMQNTQH